MGEVNTVTTLDIPYILVGVITIAVAVVFIIKLLDYIVDRFGIETKANRQKREDHELLLKTANRVEEINKDSIEHDRKLETKLDSLAQLLLDEQIDDLRYKILDFASALSNGRKYNKEQFDHILQIYKKYERILKENNLSNGQVTVSMEFINEVYKDKLKNSFDK